MKVMSDHIELVKVYCWDAGTGHWLPVCLRELNGDSLLAVAATLRNDRVDILRLGDRFAVNHGNCGATISAAPLFDMILRWCAGVDTF